MTLPKCSKYFSVKAVSIVLLWKQRQQFVGPCFVRTRQVLLTEPDGRRGKHRKTISLHQCFILNVTFKVSLIISYQMAYEKSTLMYTLLKNSGDCNVCVLKYIIMGAGLGYMPGA